MTRAEFMFVVYGVILLIVGVSWIIWGLFKNDD